MILNSIQAVVFIATASLFCALANAQVAVEDRVIGSDRTASSSANRDQSSATVQANPAAELFYKVQVMQQEILQLRGLVEEQSYQIKQLKQQRLDDYVDLDRRIGQLASQSASAAARTSDTRSSASANEAQATATSSSSAGEFDHYKSATKLILAEKDYDAGIAKLKEHLARYPNGRYAANVQYWLGEVYLAKGDEATGRTWFESLLKQYPLHNKADDAKYKLGTLYHKLGSVAQGKQYLEEVASGTGNASKLAKEYLKSNF